MEDSLLFFNVPSKRNNVITLTNYDETEKMAHDSQIVRAKENLKLSHGGPSYSQASGTNPPIKALRQSRLKSEAWPTVVQLKRKP